MAIDADLHLHGKYAGGVSDKMTIPVMTEQARIKGLDLVGTGDCLHPKWLNHVREHTTVAGDVLRPSTDAADILEEAGNDDPFFLLTTEVEDKHRVHHVLLFPSFDAVTAVREQFAPHSTDIDREGRPHLDLSGRQIAQVCEEYNVLVGPAHAFTPWTGIYKEFDSLSGCYGNMVDYVAFLELGLSADSTMADQISTHHDLPLASFSDAHSPWPHRLGREFTRFDVSTAGFTAIQQAFADNRIIQNVGFDPRHGKYHCTACTSCYQKYTLDQAAEFDWTCQECGKRIKQGVKDRIAELADADTAPGDRPDYLHVFPLATIIQQVVGHASPTTKTVQDLYDQFLDAFDAETTILADAGIDELAAVNRRVADAVQQFRDNGIVVVPGGGGAYGELVIPHGDQERERIKTRRADELACRYSPDQSTLESF